MPPELRSTESASTTVPPASEGVDARLRKRDIKRIADPVRPLDGWERYRALVDASDEGYDLIDISNREARFALIVMGALNALPLVLLTKTDTVASMTRGERYWMVGLLIGYALLLLAFILQAIEALRPGRFRPEIRDWPPESPDLPAGVRYYEDIIKRSATQHWSAWQDVRLSQLNAELAIQVHSLALKNNAKHLAVRRLYLGLRGMALMLAALLVMYVVFSWI